MSNSQPLTRTLVHVHRLGFGFGLRDPRTPSWRNELIIKNLNKNNNGLIIIITCFYSLGERRDTSYFLLLIPIKHLPLILLVDIFIALGTYFNNPLINIVY